MNADPRLQERKQPKRRMSCGFGVEESVSVLNLSEDGLCFESLTPIEEKDLLHLRLSVDLNSAIEATGQLAWLDSAKRTGGLRFLELSAPAREQIRAWLSETSTASSVRNSRASLGNLDKLADAGLATEKPVIWHVTRVPSTQLVPIERHRARTRWHFLLGVLTGLAIGTAVIISIFWYARTKLGSTAWTTANRAAQSSAEQIPASVAQPASTSPPVSEPAATKPLATEPAATQTVSVAAPKRSPKRRRPQTAEASSKDLMSSTSSPPTTPQPAAAEPPLEASQAEVASAPADSQAHSSAGPVQHPKKVSATPQQLWSAVRAGNIKAAVALADLYIRGEGVEVNCEQARVLLLAASEKNNAEATKKLQDLDQGGCPANVE